jgi:hypothetical protein
MTESADQKYPCPTCEKAQLMDFERGEGRIRSEVFCLSIGKLLDEGLPIQCSAYKPISSTQGA